MREAMRHLCYRLVPLGAVVLGLSGCLSTLQTGGGASGPLPATPPAALQTQIAARPTSQAPVAETAAAPVVAETAAAEPPPAAPTTAAEPPPAAPTTVTVSVATPLPEATSPPPTATPPPAPTLTIPTLTALSNEERWRAQQTDRRVFPALQSYTTSGSELWWYDPVNQQAILIGIVTGELVAQAEFTLRASGSPALEVPYQVNRGYGLTALSPAVLARIQAAGYGEWVETYLIITAGVQPRG